jgi:chitin synthase
LNFLPSYLQIRQRRNVAYCNHDIGRDKTFQAELPTEEQTAWIWAIFVAFLLPELGTLFRSVRMVVFKSARRPSGSDFLTGEDEEENVVTAPR